MLTLGKECVWYAGIYYTDRTDKIALTRDEILVLNHLKLWSCCQPFLDIHVMEITNILSLRKGGLEPRIKELPCAGRLSTNLFHNAKILENK